MPVTAIAGSSFTVKVGAVAYTSQVTSGTITRTPNIVITTTLGPNKVTTQTDYLDEVSCDFLYDGSTGFYKALADAADSGDSLAVEIVGGSGKWTGTVLVSALSADFSAEDISACSASFQGTLTFAAAA